MALLVSSIGTSVGAKTVLSHPPLVIQECLRSLNKGFAQVDQSGILLIVTGSVDGCLLSAGPPPLLPDQDVCEFVCCNQRCVKVLPFPGLKL